MGQGTESCGGYEVDYDPYEDRLNSDKWQQKSGIEISVEDMSLRHLRNARRLCIDAAECANFTCDEQKWLAWVQRFNSEIALRTRAEKAVKAESTAKAKPRGTKIRMVCHCGDEYDAREADLKRGWSYSCSKPCAAIRRDFGRPRATKKK